MATLLKTSKKTEKVFDLEYVHDLTYDFEVEHDDGQARISEVGRNLCLIVYRKDAYEGTRNVKTYLFPPSEEFFAAVNKSLDEKLKVTAGSYFSVCWAAMEDVLHDYLLADETFDF